MSAFMLYRELSVVCQFPGSTDMMTADECQTWCRYFLPSATSVIIFFEIPVNSSTCTTVTAANGTAGVPHKWCGFVGQHCVLCSVQNNVSGPPNFYKTESLQITNENKVGLVLPPPVCTTTKATTLQVCDFLLAFNYTTNTYSNCAKNKQMTLNFSRCAALPNTSCHSASVLPKFPYPYPNIYVTGQGPQLQPHTWHQEVENRNWLSGYKQV